MPVNYYREFADNGCVAAWKIEESIDELLQLFKPAPEDEQRYLLIKKDHHRLQWLCARYLLELIFPEAIVKYLPTGRPYLYNGPQVSISHTNGYAAVILSGAANGIDVQAHDEKLLIIQSRFTNATELKLFPDMENVLKLQYLWAIKEAVFKRYGSGLSFKENIHLIEVDSDLHACKVEASPNSGPVVHSVQLVELQDTTMAYLVE